MYIIMRKENMFIMKWFNSQSRLVQIILLLIPGINWITEIVVRVSAVLETKSEKNLLGLILAILPTGNILGWVDLVWVLVYNHLFLAD